MLEKRIKFLCPVALEQNTSSSSHTKIKYFMMSYYVPEFFYEVARETRAPILPQVLSPTLWSGARGRINFSHHGHLIRSEVLHWYQINSTKDWHPLEIHTSLIPPREVQQNQPLTYNGIKHSHTGKHMLPNLYLLWVVETFMWNMTLERAKYLYISNQLKFWISVGSPRS